MTLSLTLLIPILALAFWFPLDIFKEWIFGVGGDGGTPVSPLAREDTRERSLYRPSGSGGKIHRRQSVGPCDHRTILFSVNPVLRRA